MNRYHVRWNSERYQWELLDRDGGAPVRGFDTRQDARRAAWSLNYPGTLGGPR